MKSSNTLFCSPLNPGLIILTHTQTYIIHFCTVFANNNTHKYNKESTRRWCGGSGYCTRLASTKQTKFMKKNVPGGGVVETDSFARTDEAFIAPPLERAPAIEIGSEQEGAREIAFVKTKQKTKNKNKNKKNERQHSHRRSVCWRYRKASAVIRWRW